MPFTPTHILAIVPISACSRRLPFSALAIGCMIPDLPLFFPSVAYSQTHDPLGVLTVCMPLGLAAFMVYQTLLKVPLITLLPKQLQKRMTAYSSPRLEPSYWFFVVVAVAVTLGAYTHIVWDAFTHQGRWGTRLVPWINAEYSIAGRLVPGYKLLQHGCSAVGLPLLAILWLRILWRTEPDENTLPYRLSPTAKKLCCALLLGIPTVVSIAKLTSAMPPLEHKLFAAVTSSGAVFVILLLTYSALFHCFAPSRYINLAKRLTRD